jgi:hypothetical protein
MNPDPDRRPLSDDDEETGPNEPILPMPGGDPGEKIDAPWDLTQTEAETGEPAKRPKS